jgi:hypothetical protein
VQLRRVEPQLHAASHRARPKRAIGGKQRHVAVPLAVPTLELAVIHLAEVPRVPLHLATGTTIVLDDIPVLTPFAAFEASVWIARK